MKKTAWILLAVTWAMLPWTASAGDSEEEGTVYTTGTVVTRVTPDAVRWSISSTETDATSLPAAKTKSDAVIQRVLETVRELNPGTEDVQTGMVRTEKVYDRDERGQQKDFKHYAVHRSVVFVQKDLGRFDEVFEALVKAGNVEADFTFESSKREELLRSTRLRAVEMAREKAQAMCETAGARLGEPLWLSEYPPENRREGRDAFNSMSNGSILLGAGPSEDVLEGTLAPGVIEIRVTVYALFEIE